MTGKICKPSDEVVLCSEARDFLQKQGYAVSNRPLKASWFWNTSKVSLFFFLFLFMSSMVSALTPGVLEVDLTSTSSFFLLLPFFFIVGFLFYLRFFVFSAFLLLILGFILLLNGFNAILSFLFISVAVALAFVSK